MNVWRSVARSPSSSTWPTAIRTFFEDSDTDLRRETILQFLDAANYVVDVAQDGEWVETRKSVLHEETYANLREQTDPHSNHAQSARDRAVDAMKAVVAKWKQGQYASLPTFTTPSIEYNQRNATFSDGHATLATIDGASPSGTSCPTKTATRPTRRVC